MNDGLKTLNSRCITSDQLNAPPFIHLFANIRVSGAKNNIMPFGSDKGEKLLAVFFHSTRDVRYASRSCDKDFHGLSIAMMWVHST